MRLIDADKMIEQESYYMETSFGSFALEVASHTIELIKDAPTVMAIPKSLIDIVFEEKMAARNRCQYKSEEWEMLDAQLTAIEEVVGRWRKENDKAD